VVREPSEFPHVVKRECFLLFLHHTSMKDSIFNTSPLIDFHTHGAKHLHRADIVEIISSPHPLNDQIYSLERHPWHVTGLLSGADQAELKSQLQNENCLALGEIGLDKLKGAPFEEQSTILKSILTVANQERTPVILHCVKAFDEIFQLKNQFSSIPNWAIHGFNKNPEFASQLINRGFYLSINVEKVRYSEELLRRIPRHRLFLETDNSPILIEDNYLRATEILGIQLQELKMNIAENAKHFFGHE